MMADIREERPEDILGVRYVNRQAFDSAVEADLVDKLRQRHGLILSLVALEKAHVVGHILFSPVTVESESSSFTAAALDPMAVLPQHQRQGIGSQLVNVGLEELKKTDYDIVVVLGHPDYYPRFSFSPASNYGIKCEFDVPDEAFMLLELRPGALAERSETVKYQPEFREAE